MPGLADNRKGKDKLGFADEDTFTEEDKRVSAKFRDDIAAEYRYRLPMHETFAAGGTLETGYKYGVAPEFKAAANSIHGPETFRGKYRKKRMDAPFDLGQILADADAEKETAEFVRHYKYAYFEELMAIVFSKKELDSLDFSHLTPSDVDRLIEEFEPYYSSWLETQNGADINITDALLVIGEVGYSELMSENPDVRRNAWLMTTQNSLHSDKKLFWKKGGYENERSETVAGIKNYVGVRRYTFGFDSKNNPGHPTFVFDSRHPAWMRPVDFYSSAETTLTKENLKRYRNLLKESQKEWDSIRRGGKGPDLSGSDDSK